jgi:hypothetical protein
VCRRPPVAPRPPAPSLRCRPLRPGGEQRIRTGPEERLHMRRQLVDRKRLHWDYPHPGRGLLTRRCRAVRSRSLRARQPYATASRPTRGRTSSATDAADTLRSHGFGDSERRWSHCSSTSPLVTDMPPREAFRSAPAAPPHALDRTRCPGPRLYLHASNLAGGIRRRSLRDRRFGAFAPILNDVPFRST